MREDERKQATADLAAALIAAAFAAPAAAAAGPDADGRFSGVTQRWNLSRGFGFIKPDDGSEEVFCHFLDISDGKALADGSRVSYKLALDDRTGRQRAIECTGGIAGPEGRQPPKVS